MLTLPILSQNTRTDSIIVSVKALKSMAKESRKCDSLRVAYNLQYSTLQQLATSNLKYFKQIEDNQKKNEALQLRLDQSIKALRKQNNSWILPASIGVVAGLVGGMVLIN